MKEEKCDIVMDLLPLYLDGKTSEESRVYIENHLKNCEACRQMLRDMSWDEPEKTVCYEQTKKKLSKAKKILIISLTTYVVVVLLILVLAVVWIMSGIV